MAQPISYMDRKGRHLSLEQLDEGERHLVADLRQRAASHPDWVDFDNYWTRKVAAFYDARGVPRPESRKSLPYQIGQDLSGRLAIASGMARDSDYRDELERLIRERFKTQRAFCEATGIAEDMLCHVLARRKHLAIDTLTQALDRIGYGLHILPHNGAEDSRANGATHTAD